jgi:hypothetical protein
MNKSSRPWFSDVPIDSRGEVGLTLDLKIIPMLVGVITTPRGRAIPRVFVEVTDASHTTVCDKCSPPTWPS